MCVSFVSTVIIKVQLRDAVDLSPLRRLENLDPSTATTASTTTVSSTTASTTTASTTASTTGEAGNSASASSLAAPAPATPPVAALCVDWAPNPSHPGLLACGDGRGGVRLFSVCGGGEGAGSNNQDFEEWAKHMPVWHHRGGIRQVTTSNVIQEPRSILLCVFS